MSVADYRLSRSFIRISDGENVGKLIDPLISELRASRANLLRTFTELARSESSIRSPAASNIVDISPTIIIPSSLARFLISSGDGPRWAISELCNRRSIDSTFVERAARFSASKSLDTHEFRVRKLVPSFLDARISVASVISRRCASS